jgi:plasmid stability protein
MPILHVRNVPEPLYERIRACAESRKRSISAEVINLLEQALEEPTRPQAEVLAGLRRRRFFRPAAAGAPDSTTLLREDRSR